MTKAWPFPGESATVRARKVALAYRAVAQQRHTAGLALAELLKRADTRLLAFDAPATLQAIQLALKDFDGPDPVAELDIRFTNWGETFHCEQPEHYDMDDYVTAKIAAQILSVHAKTISVMRIKGRLAGHWDPTVGQAGGYRYKVADLYDIAAQRRTRGWRRREATDTLTDSSRSDPE